METGDDSGVAPVPGLNTWVQFPAAIRITIIPNHSSKGAWHRPLLTCAGIRPNTHAQNKLLKNYFSFIHILCVCVCILPAGLTVHHLCVMLTDPEEVSSASEFTDGHELPCGCSGRAASAFLILQRHCFSPKGRVVCLFLSLRELLI